MVKKIGFIDYYLDEWHANQYPKMFRKWTEGFEVAYAYGMIDSPKEGGLTSKQWGEKYGIQVCDSIEEVIEKSDYLVVLSPDNPEMHEELCRLPLQSGKHTYIDKTFAETMESAKRIFDMAEKGKTKCYSSSALYFADEYLNIYGKEVEHIDSCGAGKFSIYAIHQLEPIIAMIKEKLVRVMSVGSEQYPAVILEFEGGKSAKIATFNDGPFHMHIGYADGKAEFIKVDSEFFKGCIQAMAAFFETGEIPVPHENTLRVIGAVEAVNLAIKNPTEWIYL